MACPAGGVSPLLSLPACLLLLPVCFGVALGSDTGVIAGVVTGGSGAPVVGASVLVEGSSFGSMTNAQGEYYVTQLTPGDYTLIARMVGMGEVRLEGVTVISGQTTRIDIAMSEETVGETVIQVTEQRNLILESLPSTIHVIDRSEVETMPVASILDVVAGQSGISSQGGGIHVRGGRSGEVDFLLNGVSLRSPVTNTFSTGIPLSAISETSVTTGGFSTEYGNAMSGVVVMAAREGGPTLRGEVKLRGGDRTRFGGESEARNYSGASETSNYQGDLLGGELALGGPEPVTGILLPAIGVDIPGEARFFGACEWSRSGFDLEDSRGYRDNNWTNSLSGLINLTYRPGAGTRLGVLGRYSYVQSGWDEWAWSMYDTPAYIEGQPYLGGNVDYALPVRFEEDWGLSLSLSRMLRDNTFLELLVDGSVFGRWRRIRDETGGYVGEELTPAAWFGFMFPEERVADSLGFYHAGVHPEVWLESRSEILSGRAGVTTMISPDVEFRVGLEGRLYDIYDFSVFAEGPGQTFVSNWSASPRSAAAFLESSADFSGAMVLNTGLRLDMFDPNWSRIVAGEAGESRVPVKWQVSPRLGMTHPVSERDVFFATYGHYFQMPEMNQMFFGTDYNLASEYSLVGNPDLEAMRTISYEAGLRHRFDELSTLAFSAFHKEMTGLVRTAPVSGSGEDRFYEYENDDSYATAQGIELTLGRLPGRFWSGSLSYTYSLAEGRYSSATEQYEYSSQGFSVIPEDESYLDWDQRHSADAHLGLELQRGEGPALGGLRPFEGMGLSLDWSWGSGYPYSAPSEDSLPSINAERYPWTMQTDLGLSRRIWLAGTELKLQMTVYNLFDRRNIVTIYDPAYYLQTGDPGGIIGNPAAWSPARHFLFELGVEW